MRFATLSGHVAFQVNRFVLIDVSPLVSHHGDARIAVEIVIIVLAAMADKEVLLLVDQLQNIRRLVSKSGVN